MLGACQSWGTAEEPTIYLPVKDFGRPTTTTFPADDELSRVDFNAKCRNNMLEVMPVGVDGRLTLRPPHPDDWRLYSILSLVDETTKEIHASEYTRPSFSRLYCFWANQRTRQATKVGDPQACNQPLGCRVRRRARSALLVGDDQRHRLVDRGRPGGSS